MRQVKRQPFSHCPRNYPTQAREATRTINCNWLRFRGDKDPRAPREGGCQGIHQKTLRPEFKGPDGPEPVGRGQTRGQGGGDNCNVMSIQTSKLLLCQFAARSLPLLSLSLALMWPGVPNSAAEFMTEVTQF